MPKTLRLLLLSWLLLASLPLHANHLIGGELGMTYLGKPGQFRVFMKQHWNEDPNDPTRTANESSLSIYVFSRRTNTYMESIPLRQTNNRPLIYQNPACAKANKLQNVEVTYEADHQFDVNRYNDPDGYYLVWERCCRNSDLINIANAGQAGIVLYLQFPAMRSNGQDIVNSAPEFSTVPGTYACLNQPFQLAFNATDPDGDQLSYRLVTPWSGYTTQTAPLGNPTPRTSYPTIRWQTGYGDNNIIPGSVPLQINASTGQLSLSANRTGLFAFAVEVTEQRNGQVIGLTRREFYLLVVDCSKSTLEPPVISRNNTPVQTVSLCPSDSLRLSVPTSATWAYQWQRNGANIPGATSATLNVRETGLYTVVKSSTGTCIRDTVSKPVQVNQSATTVRFDSIPPMCDPNSPTVTLNVSPAGGQFQGAGVTGSSFRPGAAGAGRHAIRYTFTDSSGCRISQQRIAEVGQPIQLNVPGGYSILAGGKVTLAVSASNSQVRVQWSPPDGLNDTELLQPEASPQQSQTYTIRVTDPAGCTATASVPVRVFGQVSIPTAFTPNGDGLNDTWDLPGIGTYPDCEVTIYNRWGSVIFQSVGYAQPWDGRFRGVPVEAGAYAYQIRLGDDQNLYRGSLMVLR
ncbi:gliding motility-associated C-terminal domain-containing protein [Fibrisoma montanum]|uniref:Gliding motility-associated C-terminal domain-containing protein n=1 Tax=Fibrisoma montanum TaxID=2305895 RepID=A0A418LZA5_9BACT|nr:gliding motility-associated C-terminal domain-containing protein [Fibrisoma montanum]RIV18671.1 gliding motility-associated C-terminal domain-containing protein [Fibrisoma montanum]